MKNKDQIMLHKLNATSIALIPLGIQMCVLIYMQRVGDCVSFMLGLRRVVLEHV